MRKATLRHTKRRLKRRAGYSARLNRAIADWQQHQLELNALSWVPVMMLPGRLRLSLWCISACWHRNFLTAVVSHDKWAYVNEGDPNDGPRSKWGYVANVTGATLVAKINTTSPSGKIPDAMVCGDGGVSPSATKESLEASRRCSDLVQSTTSH